MVSLLRGTGFATAKELRQDTVALSRGFSKRVDWRECVRQVRSELGLTQRALAQHLKVTVVTVQNYEAGRYKPDPFVLRRLLDIAPENFRAQIEENLPEELRPGERRQQARRNLKRRYSEETREQLVTALETILDRAPSSVIAKVSELLTQWAGKYGTER